MEHEYYGQALDQATFPGEIAKAKAKETTDADQYRILFKDKIGFLPQQPFNQLKVLGWPGQHSPKSQFSEKLSEAVRVTFDMHTAFMATIVCGKPFFSPPDDLRQLGRIPEVCEFLCDSGLFDAAVSLYCAAALKVAEVGLFATFLKNAAFIIKQTKGTALPQDMARLVDARSKLQAFRGLHTEHKEWDAAIAQCLPPLVNVREAYFRGSKHSPKRASATTTSTTTTTTTTTTSTATRQSAPAIERAAEILNTDGHGQAALWKKANDLKQIYVETHQSSKENADGVQRLLAVARFGDMCGPIAVVHDECLHVESIDCGPPGLTAKKALQKFVDQTDCEVKFVGKNAEVMTLTKDIGKQKTRDDKSKNEIAPELLTEASMPLFFNYVRCSLVENSDNCAAILKWSSTNLKIPSSLSSRYLMIFITAVFENPSEFNVNHLLYLLGKKESDTTIAIKYLPFLCFRIVEAKNPILATHLIDEASIPLDRYKRELALLRIRLVNSFGRDLIALKYDALVLEWLRQACEAAKTFEPECYLDLVECADLMDLILRIKKNDLPFLAKFLDIMKTMHNRYYKKIKREPPPFSQDALTKFIEECRQAPPSNESNYANWSKIDLRKANADKLSKAIRALNLEKVDANAIFRRLVAWITINYKSVFATEHLLRIVHVPQDGHGPNEAMMMILNEMAERKIGTVDFIAGMDFGLASQTFGFDPTDIVWIQAAALVASGTDNGPGTLARWTRPTRRYVKNGQITRFTNDAEFLLCVRAAYAAIRSASFATAHGAIVRAIVLAQVRKASSDVHDVPLPGWKVDREAILRRLCTVIAQWLKNESFPVDRNPGVILAFADMEASGKAKS